MTNTPPDKIEIYAAALQSDIGAERFEVVEGGKLRRYWIGTVYGGGVAHGARLQVRHARESMAKRFGFCRAMRRDCERASQEHAMSSRDKRAPIA